jgi:leader peptidase (prepilin peptidase) / N-methyltransferase
MLALTGVLGAVTGSFLNVVVHRMPQGLSLSRPRSRCPDCERPIQPWDNIPIVSWLLLRGRCRHCAKSIPARYPLVEAVTAVLFGVVTLVNGFDESLLWELPLVAALVAIAAIDLEHRIIPNRIVLPLAVYGLAIAAVLRPDALPELAIAGAGAFLFLFVAALAYPAGMGMGDVKLAGAMGIYLGLSVVPALFAAFLTGTVVGVVIMAREGAGARKKGVPFGPFLALGGLVAVLAGPQLIDLYESLFLS